LTGGGGEGGEGIRIEVASGKKPMCYRYCVHEIGSRQKHGFLFEKCALRLFDKCALRLEKVVCEHGKIVANLSDKGSFNQRHSAVILEYTSVYLIRLNEDVSL
jgi:hypothetical protein